jgi:hypothetical protein
MKSFKELWKSIQSTHTNLDDEKRLQSILNAYRCSTISEVLNVIASRAKSETSEHELQNLLNTARFLRSAYKVQQEKEIARRKRIDHIRYNIDQVTRL